MDSFSIGLISKIKNNLNKNNKMEWFCIEVYKRNNISSYLGVYFHSAI